MGFSSFGAETKTSIAYYADFIDVEVADLPSVTQEMKTSIVLICCCFLAEFAQNNITLKVTTNESPCTSRIKYSFVVLRVPFAEISFMKVCFEKLNNQQRLVYSH